MITFEQISIRLTSGMAPSSRTTGGTQGSCFAYIGQEHKENSFHTSHSSWALPAIDLSELIIQLLT
jgi:hypothetical protein